MSYPGPDFRAGATDQMFSGPVGDFHKMSIGFWLLIFIAGPPICCIIYAIMELIWLKSIKTMGEDAQDARFYQMKLQLDGAETDCLHKMREIADAIAEGANSYMDTQSK